MDIAIKKRRELRAGDRITWTGWARSVDYTENGCSVDNILLGKNYFIRTVTHHLVGTLIEVTAKELWLKDVSWIADDGRFMQAIANGDVKEVEPFPDGEEIPVGRGALIDAVIWHHELPRKQK